MRISFTKHACMIYGVIVVAFSGAAAAGGENLLKNGAFEDLDKSGFPVGWNRYTQKNAPTDRAFRVRGMRNKGGVSLLISDSSSAREKSTGLYQIVPVREGMEYSCTLNAKAMRGRQSNGVVLQIRFFPSNQCRHIVITPKSAKEYTQFSLSDIPPKDTTSMWVLLYTQYEPKPAILVDDIRLVARDPNAFLDSMKLKKLHLDTTLVREGKPAAVIVAPKRYSQQASQIVSEVARSTGCKLKVVDDRDYLREKRLTENAVLIGNRSTNAAISRLYDMYFCLLDLRYPGKGGSVVRSLHNPFGDGHNVILAGGSDEAGTREAVRTLASKIASTAVAGKTLTLPRLMEIKLGEGIEIPREISDVKTWEDSKGYGSAGYFGWNSISKNMALYYMTGQEKYAKEVLRLSFPDAKAQKDIERVDKEMLPNRKAPLTEPYHYGASLLAIYWDLIEESPVFSEADRLAITKDLYTQFSHYRDGGGGGNVYKRFVFAPNGILGDRHELWGAVCLYTVSRYFARDYSDQTGTFQRAINAVENYFHTLKTDCTVTSKNGNLIWLNTSLEPFIRFLLLHGWKDEVNLKAVRRHLDAFECLTSGQPGSSSLLFATPAFLRKSAYIFDDSLFLQMCDESGMNTDVFRVGQSFEPDDRLKKKPWARKTGQWQFARLDKFMQQRMGPGYTPDNTFRFCSYRNRSDDKGDYVFVDGFFELVSRYPYHNLTIAELRLAGVPILNGYFNHLVTRWNGVVSPQQPKNAVLDSATVLGDTSVLRAEVRGLNGCDWTRTLAIRNEKFVLVTDELEALKDISTLDAEISWALGQRGDTFREVSPGHVELEVPVEIEGVTDLDFVKLSPRARVSTLIRFFGGIGFFYRATEPGDWMEIPFTVDKSMQADMEIAMPRSKGYGIVNVSLDGKVVAERVNLNHTKLGEIRVKLGRHDLSAGEHVIRLTVAARDENLTTAFIGFTSLRIADVNRSSDAEATRKVQLCTGQLPGTEMLVDHDSIAPSKLVKTIWSGKLAKGKKAHFVSLLSFGQPETNKVYPIAANAAIANTPDPVLVVCGEYGQTSAKLAIVEPNRVYALDAARCEGLLESDVPVTVDWDLKNGVLQVHASQKANLTLAAFADANVKATSASGGRILISVRKGTHVYKGITPSVAVLAGLEGRIARLKKQAEKSQTIAADAGEGKQLPAVKAAWSASCDGFIADTQRVSTNDQQLLAVAAGKTVSLLDSKGQQKAQWKTDDLIRVLHYWAEEKLLVAGCIDEKVIAFDLQGNRKWTFVSELAPEVKATGKYYWFKSAAGMNGIHSLNSGVFLNGPSQLFAGSANTIEILDRNGKLIKRLPQFWGPVTVIEVAPSFDGKDVNLMTAQSYNGLHSILVTSRKDLSKSMQCFRAVPAGYNYVTGWSSMNHNRIIVDDVNADGELEVVSDINGLWNRISVWKLNGVPLHDVSFGPGKGTAQPKPAPGVEYRNMCDMDVVDIDGDGKKEIIAAVPNRILIGLDNTCQVRWVVKCKSQPLLVEAVGSADGRKATILVACKNGDVLKVDAEGNVIGVGKVEGIPVNMIRFGGYVIVSTDTGRMEAFAVGL